MSCSKGKGNQYRCQEASLPHACSRLQPNASKAGHRMNEWMLVKKNVGIERTKAIHIRMFCQQPTVTSTVMPRKGESFCGEIDPAKRLRRKPGGCQGSALPSSCEPQLSCNNQRHTIQGCVRLQVQIRTRASEWSSNLILRRSFGQNPQNQNPATKFSMFL